MLNYVRTYRCTMTSQHCLGSSESESSRPRREKLPTFNEVAIDGLLWKREAPLVIKKAGCMGRGVFAAEDIPPSTFICEYKTNDVLSKSKFVLFHITVNTSPKENISNWIERRSMNTTKRVVMWLKVFTVAKNIYLMPQGDSISLADISTILICLT